MLVSRITCFFKNNISLWGMIVLFPGFLFYHFFCGYYAVQLPLAGLFGPMSALIFGGSFLVLTLRVFGRVSFAAYELLAISFFLYTLFYIIIHFLFAGSEYYTKIAVIQSLESWVLWLAVFFTSLWLPQNTRLLRFLNSFTLIVSAIFLAWYFYTTGSLIFIARKAFDAEYVATYQGFSRSIFVIALFLLAFTKNKFAKVVLIFTSFFVLFMLGARSELATYLFVIIAVWSISILKGKKSSILVFFVLIIVYMGFFSNLNTDRLEGSRHSQLLDLSNASSWVKRQELQKTAIQQIKQYPVVGYFGGHIAHYDSKGSYSHNLLSAWVNYGILGFVMYLSLTLIPLLHSSLLAFTNKSLSTDWRLVFLSSAAFFLMVLVAKSVFYALVPMAWGFYARALKHSRSARFANDPTLQIK